MIPSVRCVQSTGFSRVPPARKTRKLLGLENLVGPLQLAILALEGHQPLALTRGQPRARAGVALRLAHPLPQRLGRRAELGRHRLQRGPLRRMRRPLLHHQPDGALTHLRRKTKLDDSKLLVFCDLYA